VDRVVTRDVPKMKVGQVAYTNWCDGQGKVIDDGTVSRLQENLYRWTAAEPNLRWIHMNAHGLDVNVEDITDRVGALALQGPTSRAILEACVEGADVGALKYFRVTSGKIRGIPVEISRTGYTGDLGYEVWVEWGRGEELYDLLMDVGRPYDITPTGMLALDVARIEAGLILLDVDYTSSRKALIESQKYSPYEIGLGRLVNLEKSAFIGQQPLRQEVKAGAPRQLVGFEIDWDDIDRLYDSIGMSPQIPATASRVSVPVYRGGAQVGKATSTTWSPTLKKMIALGTIATSSAAPGTRLEVEVTVNHERKRAGATVRALPFFDPPRKRA
jgi:aminomethyltransferase